jgi:hypothetical protein
MQQDSGIRRRNDGDLFQDFPEGWAVAHDIFKAALRADFWFEIELIGFEPANVRKACCCKSPDISEINIRARHNLLLPSLLYSRIASDTASEYRAAGFHVHSCHNENFGKCEPTVGFGSDVKHG